MQPTGPIHFCFQSIKYTFLYLIPVVSSVRIRLSTTCIENFRECFIEIFQSRSNEMHLPVLSKLLVILYLLNNLLNQPRQFPILFKPNHIHSHFIENSFCFSWLVILLTY